MKKLLRKTEPSEGLIHYDSVGVMDAVTLCGLTDFIGQESGVETDMEVTCICCKSIVKEIQSAQKEKF